MLLIVEEAQLSLRTVVEILETEIVGRRDFGTRQCLRNIYCTTCLRCLYFNARLRGIVIQGKLEVCTVYRTLHI